MRCNQCGKEITDKEQAANITVAWGYFSNKDGEKHQIHICEACYDVWIKNFTVPVEIEEETELL
jgi:hypothetical protein